MSNDNSPESSISPPERRPTLASIGLALGAAAAIGCAPSEPSQALDTGGGDSLGDPTAAPTSATPAPTSSPTEEPVTPPPSDGTSGSTSASTTGPLDDDSTGAPEPPEPVDPFPGMGEPQLVVSDLGFGEGPVWSSPRQRLFFTDVTNELILALDGDEVSTHRANSGGADGLALDPDDRIIAAQIFAHHVARETADGLEAIATTFEGTSLNAPNDVTVGRDGAVYFTDPTNTGHQPQGFAGVYRLAPGASEPQLIDDALDFPNGILLSLDQTVLYVAESSGQQLWAYDVADDGTVDGKRMFASTMGQPDGLSTDVTGNVYATNGDGFEAFSPDGERWGQRVLPTEAFVSNLAFGGPRGQLLFVTTADELWRIEVDVPGPV